MSNIISNVKGYPTRRKGTFLTPVNATSKSTNSWRMNRASTLIKHVDSVNIDIITADDIADQTANIIHSKPFSNIPNDLKLQEFLTSNNFIEFKTLLGYYLSLNGQKVVIVLPTHDDPSIKWELFLGDIVHSNARHPEFATSLIVSVDALNDYSPEDYISTVEFKKTNNSIYYRLMSAPSNGFDKAQPLYQNSDVWKLLKEFSTNPITVFHNNYKSTPDTALLANLLHEYKVLIDKIPQQMELTKLLIGANVEKLGKTTTKNQFTNAILNGEVLIDFPEWNPEENGVPPFQIIAASTNNLAQLLSTCSFYETIVYKKAKLPANTQAKGTNKQTTEILDINKPNSESFLQKIMLSDREWTKFFNKILSKIFNFAPISSIGAQLSDIESNRLLAAQAKVDYDKAKSQKEIATAKKEASLALKADVEAKNLLENPNPVPVKTNQDA